MSRLSPEARKLAAYAAATMQMTHAVRRYQKRKSVSSILLGKAIEALLADLADAERRLRESEYTYDSYVVVRDQRDAAQAQVATLRDVIAGMRWVQPRYNGSPSCAYCGEQKHLHTSPCGVDELLASTAPEQAAQEGGEG